MTPTLAPLLADSYALNGLYVALIGLVGALTVLVNKAITDRQTRQLTGQPKADGKAAGKPPDPPTLTTLNESMNGNGLGGRMDKMEQTVADIRTELRAIAAAMEKAAGG